MSMNILYNIKLVGNEGFVPLVRCAHCRRRLGTDMPAGISSSKARPLFSSPIPTQEFATKKSRHKDEIYFDGILVGNEGFEPPMPDSESGALPLGEFPVDE